MPETDLSEFFKYSKPKRPPCRIGFALDLIRTKEADKEETLVKRGDAKKLEAALATDKNLITATAIIEWLSKRGIDAVTNASPVTGHRKKTCTCYSD